MGRAGFASRALADVLPVNIGPAQRQAFGDPLREDVQLKGPVKMRPAEPLGVRHPMMQLEGAEVGGQRSGAKANANGTREFGRSCRRWMGRMGLGGMS